MTPSSYSVKRNRTELTEVEDKKSTQERMFTEMINVMIMSISDQFYDVPKLKFLCLLDPKQFANYQWDFPIEAMKFLMKTCGRHFDPVHLKNELVAL
jgi:hypothetical protein